MTTKKNLIKLHDDNLFDITEEEFDGFLSDIRFTHTGKTGIPEEPLRHWTSEEPYKNYPDNLILKRIWKHIDEKLCPDLELEVVKSFVNLYSHGDSSWAHVDICDYTFIAFINPLWNINWGGETLFFSNQKDKVLFGAYPKTGSVVQFSGNILHRVAPLSREAVIPRVGVTFQTNVIS